LQSGQNNIVKFALLCKPNKNFLLRQ
jgi:hypothetical protein